MKKLSLSLEDLAVESFDTTAAERKPGTVRGHDSGGWSCDSICPTVTDPERCCKQWY